MKWAGAALAALCLPAAAALPQFCDVEPKLTAREQDRLLRFADVAKRALADSGASVALIARSGTDLSRFGIRYSHTGISLRASANGAWSVRQLYYACDEGRPQLYDQGLAGFVSGTDNPARGHLSMVLLPAAEGAALEAAVLDGARALKLLAGTYSANAYPFSLRYQNCNQWIAELLAGAWGGSAERADAQAWLAREGYAPPPVEIGSHWLMAVGGFIPWLHLDDHPEADVQALRLRISLPAAIEDFVRARLPQARRIELCHDERQVVVRHGWRAMGPGCSPDPGDEVVALD